MGPVGPDTCCRRAAEHSGKETDEDGAVKTGHGSDPGRDAERQGQRQGDNGGGQPAVKIAADVIKVKSVNELHGAIYTHRPGMGTTAFVAYLSSLCNVAYTATQYALLSSLMAFTRTFFASGGGWLADNMDWVTYFLITTLAAVPGLLILLWLMRRGPEAERGEPP